MGPFGRDQLAAALAEACAVGRAAAPGGQVARYIPQLACSDPNAFGVALAALEPDVVLGEGDAHVRFTLQSVSKVFALAALLEHVGDALFENIGVEPSGDAFHSIVRLEEENGIPRNPLINAGAIAVSARLPGATVEGRIRFLQDFLARLCPGGAFAVDESVRNSEARTGDRNRALAHFMRHHGRLADPVLAVETYFAQCALTADALSLARLGRVLANGGRDPRSGAVLIRPAHNRTLLALMTTCGLYDEVGRFAIDVGMPAKSGVSGGLLAIAPGRLAVACYGPALGPKGNSVGGVAALRLLADRLQLSLFGHG